MAKKLRSVVSSPGTRDKTFNDIHVHPHEGSRKQFVVSHMGIKSKRELHDQGHLKIGDVVSSSDLDDLHDAGYKVKEVNPPNK